MRETSRMTNQTNLGGTFTLPGTSMTLNRMGYGAMQLAGPHVWGPPRDVDAAIAVLREAVARGVNHIDTSDFYGPHVTNQIIKQALHPYPEGLVIVTKVGARRGEDKSWIHALSRQELIDGVHDNLRNLGLDSARCRQSSGWRGHGAIGGIHRRAADRARRTQAPGTDSSSRSEQRQPRAVGRGADDHGDRLRAEPLQRGAPERRWLHRRSRRGRASPMCRSFRLGGFTPLAVVSARRSRQRRWRPRPCRSRSRGCFSARPTSC